MTSKKVLVVDDESSIREMLRLALEISDFECLEARDIHEAYRVITDDTPDIVLLDWMLPGGSGLNSATAEKGRGDAVTAVIMLTAKTHEDNVIQGLEVGADDYMTKPFAPKELIARMKALLRRTSSDQAGSALKVGDLVLEIDSRRVLLENKPLEMGPTEFKLLHFFMANPERATLAPTTGSGVGCECLCRGANRRRSHQASRKALQAGNAVYADLIQTVRGTYRFSPRDLSVS